MSSDSETQFTIVGSGLAGALFACYLGRAGHRVHMYERRPDLRRGDVPAGRSINLAISHRGIRALDRIGVAGRILDLAIPMKGRMMHSPSGGLSFQPYGTEKHHVINSVSRAALNTALLDTADNFDGVRLHFDSRCTGMDLETGRIQIQTGDDGYVRDVDGGTVIGADGAYSAIRAEMQREDRFDYRQDYLTHGYKELCIPARPDGGFAMEKNALHIWPRASFMMIALPNIDGSYTCTLFAPFQGKNSFELLQKEDDVREFFQREFPDAVALMPTLVEDFFENPTSSLVTVRCYPWHHRDRAVLIGDAAHAVVPFYGQGMNAAFEDCIVLDECMERWKPDWESAFAEYGKLRKEHADTLADLAIGNFTEMRDHVASYFFLIKKSSEKLLHRLFPKWYLPLYTMVSFSRTPYADAVRRAEHQSRVVRRVGTALLAALAVALIFVIRALV